MSGYGEPGSSTLPRLVVVKGSFAAMGGAERDLLRNLPALAEIFSVRVATLEPVDELVKLCEELRIPLFTPKDRWKLPTGSLSIVFDLQFNSAKRAWKDCSGLEGQLAMADGIHVVSGDGSLAILDLIPDSVPTHFHLLEPHRGLHEDVLHRRIDGVPKRNLALTRFLLKFARGRDLRLIRALARRANARISGNSSYTVSRIMDVYGVEAGLLLPSVDASEFPAQPDLAEPENFDDISAPYVVNIGRASWAKGTLAAIELLAETEFGLAHVGGASSADAAKMREKATELGVRLWIAPRLNSAELSGLMRGARASISLARGEPFGLTPIEAFSVGTPALFVDEGGFRDTITDSVNGRLLPRSDSNAWKSALSEAGIAETRESWTNAGRARIAELDLTPSAHARRVKSIFAEISNR